MARNLAQDVSKSKFVCDMVLCNEGTEIRGHIIVPSDFTMSSDIEDTFSATTNTVSKNIASTSISSSNRALGITGTHSSNPPELHACCVKGVYSPVFWNLTLIDYKENKLYLASNVMQEFPNIDNISLTLDYTDFIENPSTHTHYPFLPLHVPETMDHPEQCQVKKFEFTTLLVKNGKEFYMHCEKYYSHLFDHEGIVVIGHVEIA